MASIERARGMRIGGQHMNNKYCLFIILFIGVVIITGHTAETRPVVGETAYLPLNEGVKDLSFLSEGEVEILETINKTRGASAITGSFQPLKISKGLSFAAKERAEELARSRNPDLTKEEERNRLFERVRKFGIWKGSVAEVASHGYPAGAVVPELMKGSPTTGQQPQSYFVDTKFTVMGVGCTSAGTPGPICVITLATEFSEAR
jgi:uncharacterized protein YkwD